MKGEWWVVSQGSKHLHVECEGFTTLKRAEKYRDESCPEGLVLKVPSVLLNKRDHRDRPASHDDGTL